MALDPQRFDRLLEFAKFGLECEHVQDNSFVGQAINSMIKELKLGKAQPTLYKYEGYCGISGQRTPITAEDFIHRYGRTCLGSDITYVNNEITLLEEKLERLTEIKTTIERLGRETEDILGLAKHCQNEYKDVEFDYLMKKDTK